MKKLLAVPSFIGAAILLAAIFPRKPVPLDVVYTNTPACAHIETSTDLTNWECFAELRRCGSNTNGWSSISWGGMASGSNQFWRVLPCD